MRATPITKNTEIRNRSNKIEVKTEGQHLTQDTRGIICNNIICLKVDKSLPFIRFHFRTCKPATNLLLVFHILTNC